MLHECRFLRDGFVLQSEEHDFIEESERRLYVAHGGAVGFGLEEGEGWPEADGHGSVLRLLVKEFVMELFHLRECVGCQTCMSGSEHAFAVHYFREVM